MNASTRSVPWQRIDATLRKRIVWWTWLVTWLVLLAGFFDRCWFAVVVAFSFVHAVAMLALHRFSPSPYPVQVRIAYLLLVAAGTWMPGGYVLMLVMALGLPGNLLFDYCLLARLLHLLPWNRSEALSPGLLRRVICSPPTQGRFQPRPDTSLAMRRPIG